MAIWLGAFAVGSSPAQAHTDLQGSTPASGARLDAAPAELQLRFTADISPDFAQLSLIRGDEPAERLEATVRGPVVTAGVPARSGTWGGRVAWDVSYRVISADGHPVTGTVEFTAPMGAAPPPSAAPGSPSEAPAAPGADADEAVGVEDSETEDAGEVAGADQGDADDSGSLPSVVTIAAAALALAVTAAALVVAVRRRSQGPR